MKVIFSVLFLLGSFSTTANSLTYRNDINPKYYNDVWKKQFESSARIDYDPERDEYDFYIKQNLYLVGFTIPRPQADELIEAIDKYKAWREKAINESVKLAKDIAQIEAKFSFWKAGKGEWRNGNEAQLTMHFFSRNTEIHQLVVFIEKFVDRKNSFVTHKPDELYFDYDVAMKLREALTREHTQAFLVEAKKKAEIDAAFQ